MLIRHSLQYLVARGVPGIVNFLALAIYTRFLTTDEYGQYMLVISVLGLAHVFAFQWLLLVLGRFYPKAGSSHVKVQQHVLAIFILISGAILLLGSVFAYFAAVRGLVVLFILAVIFAVTYAWHELNLRLVTARLEPRVYGLLSGTKAVFALIVGAGLALLGLGAEAPLLGLIVGSLVGWWFASRHLWRNVRPRWPPLDSAREYMAYGFPLALTFALSWITLSADRMIIALLVDESAVGYYSAGHELAQQSLGLLLSIVNTAATPLVIRTLEEKGVEAASRQLKQNGDLVMVLALAGAAGLIAIGPAVVGIFVGSEFREGALSVFPWIAIAAAVLGVKSFYFDIAFHLSRRSRWLLLTSGLAAVVGVLLNFVLIPLYGIVGSAWACLAGFSTALVSSACLGRRVFPMPNPAPIILKALLVAAVTYCAAYAGSVFNLDVKAGLILSLVFGVAAAFVGSAVLDVAGLRSSCRGFFRRRLANYGKGGNG